eukprot:TRINITY_DN2719_c0_g3_i2.p1 TRINITY_DN2719_c0_g3~~TRINITY_DN2719_c0_g3_i2.p1  ORF type:complete len:204 (-),score=51.70 TRINITY_DN2719_c0_g3_i2:113-724(-)
MKKRSAESAFPGSLEETIRPLEKRQRFSEVLARLEKTAHNALLLSGDCSSSTTSSQSGVSLCELHAAATEPTPVALHTEAGATAHKVATLTSIQAAPPARAAITLAAAWTEADKAEMELLQASVSEALCSRLESSVNISASLDPNKALAGSNSDFGGGVPDEELRREKFLEVLQGARETTADALEALLSVVREAGQRLGTSHS